MHQYAPIALSNIQFTDALSIFFLVLYLIDSFRGVIWTWSIASVKQFKILKLDWIVDSRRSDMN